MSTKKITVLFFASVFCFVHHSTAQNTKEVTCAGKIVNEQGKSVAGVKVTLYKVEYDRESYSSSLNVAEDTMGDADGNFSFSCNVEEHKYRPGYIVAQKDGLAIGFDRWNIWEGDKELEIKLSGGKKLSGTVVDEDDNPVSDAQVDIFLMVIGEGEGRRDLSHVITKELFAVRTNQEGKFEFAGIPAEATVEFIVEKTGKATINTFRRTEYPNQKLQYAPGQADIKLVMPVEAKIEGITIEEDTGKPVGGIRILVMNENRFGSFETKVFVSGEDGTFSVGALNSEKYVLQLVQPWGKVADWIANPVEVVAKSGEVTSDVKLELCKGGILEFLFTDAVSKKPVKGAGVNIEDYEDKLSRYGITAYSDENGIAGVRLIPRGYKIMNFFAEGYAGQSVDKPVVVESGKTTRLEYQLTKQPRITGVVRDEKGEPVEGVEIKVFPMSRQTVRSDVDGKYEIVWDPGFWGERDAVFCLVAIHEQQNLSKVVEISKDTGMLDIKLKPSVILTGKVIGPDGKGIPDARIDVSIRVSHWGTSLNREQDVTDDNGNYRIKTIPAGNRYSVSANAKGYGSDDADIDTVEAIDNRLEVETLKLALADLSVSGKVVDLKGNAVANANIRFYGEGQPDSHNRGVQTDAEGKFTINELCAGRINLNIDARRDGKRLSANVVTDVGASDIEIVVREGRSAPYYIKAKTYDQIIRSGTKVIAGVVVDENDSSVAGVPVGVCCIKRKREDGKYVLTFSSYSELSDMTDEQGRFAIELEEDAEYNLRFSPDDLAALIVYDIPTGKKDLKVTLPEGGTVIGQLLRMENGEKVPIPGVEVKIEQVERASYSHLGFDRDRTVSTDSQGRFNFEHIRTKIRTNRNENVFEPRVWQVSYANASESVGFYDDNMTKEIELIVKPDLSSVSSLVGRTLPEFDGVDIKIASEEIKDKMVLVCFFDMNQRPSRFCLGQLKNMTNELEGKGIVVIAIQAAEVEADNFKAWVEKFDADYPMGIVRINPDEIKSMWGIHAFPWMVLTDSKHIVCAEGFGINELNEKIK